MTTQLPEGFVLDAPQAVEPQSLPDGFTLDSPAEPRGDLPTEIENEKGIFEFFSEWVGGEGRNTRDIQNLPNVIEGGINGGGFLDGSSPLDIAKIATLTMLTNDPNELANIIQKQLPNVAVQYNKDAKGDIYPILVNRNNGVTAIVDRPGVDLMNMGQFFGQAGLFAAGGPGKSTGLKAVLKVGAQEAAKETAIQGTQYAYGGDVDAADILVSGALGGGFTGLGVASNAAFKAIKGQPVEEASGVIAAAKDLNIPVYSSDIYNPKNWFSRGMQIFSEWLPVVGTGSMRNAQQDARNEAMDVFVNSYRGGTYEDVIQGIGRKNADMKQAASDVYNKVNPYLDQLSQGNGIPLTNSRKKLDELTNYLLTPGREVEDNALNLIDDLDTAFNSGTQSFQIIKDNIGAWTDKMDSLDPASRVNDSNVTRQFKGVLAALRDDRDAFAKANLNEADYTALKNADAAWGDIIKDQSTTKLKSILRNGDATPEVVRNMMFSRNKSDIERLYKSLDPQGQSSARAAFITQIADDLGKQRNGLSPTSLQGALNKYQDGLDVLFTGERLDEVKGLMNVFEATARAQEVTKGAGSETFERVAGVGAAAAAGTGAMTGLIPWEGLVTYAGIGGVARLFESPKVRNILVKMNGIDPRSETALMLTSEFNNLLRASLQANPLKGQSDVEQEISNELRLNKELQQ